MPPSFARLRRRIGCRAWCTQWAANSHGKPLSAEAAKLLVDLVGGDMGQLDQELAKLAIYVGTAKRIESSDVDKLVGNSRAETMWKIFDAIGAGSTAEALTILDRLFDQGEEPLRHLWGPSAYELRRLAQAARWHLQGQPLARALERARRPALRTPGRGTAGCAILGGGVRINSTIGYWKLTWD